MSGSRKGVSGFTRSLTPFRSRPAIDRLFIFVRMRRAHIKIPPWKRKGDVANPYDKMRGLVKDYLATLPKLRPYLAMSPFKTPEIPALAPM
jgi:hypothetical protein